MQFEIFQTRFTFTKTDDSYENFHSEYILITIRYLILIFYIFDFLDMETYKINSIEFYFKRYFLSQESSYLLH